MRKKIVAGNWKMNNTQDEGLSLASEVVALVKNEVKGDVMSVLIPPFVHISNIAKIVDGSDKVFLGAQNCSEHESGAYTGEISTKMLKSFKVTHVTIGHSERREYFNESNKQLAAKVDIALKDGLTPIFCCGEALGIREANEQDTFVCNQLTEGLFHLSTADFKKLVIAYEPIWAIGTGKTASAAQAQEMHKTMREHLASKYGNEVAQDTSILYGGSCKPSNANEIFAGPDVDGGLIGGAALKARDFVDIMKAF